MLISGLQIQTDLSKQERVWLSTGIEKLKTLDDEVCDENVFAPKEPWYLPSVKEEEIIFYRGTTLSTEYQTIGLIRLPENLIEEIEKLSLKRFEKVQEVNDFLLISRKWKKIENELLKFSSKYQIVKEQQKGGGVCCQLNGYKILTINPITGKHLGLHIDSWEKYPLSKLSVARNRICFNIGYQPRYLLFINQEINDLLKFISTDNNRLYGDDEKYKIMQDFILKNSNYSVLKMKVNPYEAYIAPTENIIHDGANDGVNGLDIHVSYRSYYRTFINNS